MKNFEMPSLKKISFSQFENIAADMEDFNVFAERPSDPNWEEEL